MFDLISTTEYTQEVTVLLLVVDIGSWGIYAIRVKEVHEYSYYFKIVEIRESLMSPTIFEITG